MPKRRRPMLLALILAAASAGAWGCGGDNGPEPSIPAADAETLLSRIAEIEANVEVGSCLVAEDRTDELLAEIEALPPSVNDDVRRALENGANNLKLLVTDPTKCERATTTTETTTTAPTTTEEDDDETTTERTRPETTPTQTQPTTPTTPTQPTTPTTPGGTSGGIGPGGL